MSVSNELRGSDMTNTEPGWQPIVTAPMDGSEILVYEPADDGLGPDGPKGFISLVGWCGGQWCDDMSIPYDSPPEPTHWRPLPPPPE